MNKKLLGAIALIILSALGYQTGGLDQLLGGGRGSPSNSQRSTPVSASGADGFDYFLYVLSWSPSFCEAQNDSNSRQCNGRGDYGFIVHGLWPQFERGYPEFCDVRARVSDRIVDDMMPIMPAKGLIYHQWKKHGTCSGLQPDDYFRVIQEASRRIKTPDTLKSLNKDVTLDPQIVEDAFMEANPSLDDNEIVTRCRDGRLYEVRICVDKSLTPRACSRDVANDCRQRSVRMPGIR